MFRPLLAGLLAAGVVFAAGLSGTTAQEKKEPPKKKERIAIAEPKDAAKDPDFAVQGEYVGEISSGDKKSTVGAQVIAKGLSEFDLKVYVGGLPGAGWDGKTVMAGSGFRKGEEVALSGTDPAGRDIAASIIKGELVLQTPT